MTLVAGVDIGNSTTEIVVADTTVQPPHPLIWDRAPTRGTKGSAEAARGAAALLSRLERRLGRTADRVLMTPQVPVATRRVDIPLRQEGTGPVVVLAVGAATPAGVGHGVGRPVDISGPILDVDGPVVLVARDPLGFRDTVDRIGQWRAAGPKIAAVLLAGDEAALVGARLDFTVPIVDGVNPDEALGCRLIAVEVAPPGQHVRLLADPIHLAAVLELDPSDHEHARRAGARTYGHRCAAFGLAAHPMSTAVRADRAGSPDLIDGVRLADGVWVPFSGAEHRLASSPVGYARGYRTPGQPPRAAEDVWLVDLERLAELPGLRAGTIATHRVVLAALAAGEDATPVQAFEEIRTGRVDVVGSESGAGRAGALTTPGVRRGAWVIDLGGGTVDAIGPDGQSRTAAGCGELMTAGVAHLLDVSSGAAEWVKRGPSSRVESPFVRSDENGGRRFVESAAPHGTVGWLVSQGPTGDLPFSRSLSPAEWRALRLTLKRRVFADNLGRVLADVAHGAPLLDVLVVGGPAGDDEILEALNPALGGATVGRADVAGLLGHRWAVAYGLIAQYGA